MKITAEIHDYSESAKTPIRVHNHWNHGEIVELEVNGERYTVKGSELISAINRCMLNTFEDMKGGAEMYREETCENKSHCYDYEHWHCAGCNGCNKGGAE